VQPAERVKLLCPDLPQPVDAVDVQQPPVDQQVDEPELATELLRGSGWAEKRRQHRLAKVAGCDALEIQPQAAADLRAEGALVLAGSTFELQAHALRDDRVHDRRLCSA